MKAFPTATKLIFWGGDEATLLRMTPIIKNHTNYSRMFLIPTEQTKWRHNILESQLDRTITEYGVIIKEYPQDYYIEISDNPENRIGLMVCYWDGTNAVGSKLVEMKKKIARLQQSIRILESENAKLREQYKVGIERIRSFEEYKQGKRK